MVTGPIPAWFGSLGVSSSPRLCQLLFVPFQLLVVSADGSGQHDSFITCNALLRRVAGTLAPCTDFVEVSLRAPDMVS
ncbi:hypothetical protein JOE65_001073 [Arthrobacter roseus]|nr:hypothetical protein [Arthrobacter roseus]